MVNIEYFANKMKREREARSAPLAPGPSATPPSRQCSPHADSQADAGTSSEELLPAA
jgi:hypothetical protein